MMLVNATHSYAVTIYICIYFPKYGTVTHGSLDVNNNGHNNSIQYANHWSLIINTFKIGFPGSHGPMANAFTRSHQQPGWLCNPRPYDGWRVGNRNPKQENSRVIITENGLVVPKMVLSTIVIR